MQIGPYSGNRDFEALKSWISDERTHALWCANRIPWPLTKEGLDAALETAAREYGDAAYTAMENGSPVGFFVFNVTDGVGFFKFVILDQALRGRGMGTEMMELAAEYAFCRAGARAVRLNVFDCNDAAKRCYAKAGFVENENVPECFAFREEKWGRCGMMRESKGRRMAAEWRE